MITYSVSVSRTQVQSVRFIVQASNLSELKNKLDNVDFAEIDERFDGGEVDSIDYDVTEIYDVAEMESSSISVDDDLQDLL